jgi:hypothetical protein
MIHTLLCAALSFACTFNTTGLTAPEGYIAQTAQAVACQPPDVAPCTYELDRLLRRFGGNVSVYYENMNTGFVYAHNANRVFFGASLSKASFALYLYQRAERGEICLDEVLTYTHADFNTGAGLIVQRYRVGTTFTVRELIRLNLSHSDNIATLMLRRHFGIEGYRRFVASLGANPRHVHGNIFDSNLTARDAGILAREIYRFIEEGSVYGGYLQAAMLNNQFPFTTSAYPKASKTGFTPYSSWHCMSVVYASSPYVLVILSRRDAWEGSPRPRYAEIAAAFQRFNDEWFYVPEETPNGKNGHYFKNGGDYM